MSENIVPAIMWWLDLRLTFYLHSITRRTVFQRNGCDKDYSGCFVRFLYTKVSKVPHSFPIHVSESCGAASRSATQTRLGRRKPHHSTPTRGSHTHSLRDIQKPLKVKLYCSLLHLLYITTKIHTVTMFLTVALQTLLNSEIADACTIISISNFTCLVPKVH